MKKKPEKLKSQKKIGLCHGVFDILHIGHLWHFKEAKKKVDYLIVSVTSKELVQKTPGKPIFNDEQRAEILRSIDVIDEVIISNEKSAVEVIKKIKPDLYFKGQDYKNKKGDLSKKILDEERTVKKFGGKIFFTETPMFSSSQIHNNKFNFLSPDAAKYIKKINRTLFEKKLDIFFKKKINQKITIFGEAIIDVMRFVIPSGKSNKNSIIATRMQFEEKNGGGTILVANFLSIFFRNIEFVFCGKKKNLKILKKFLNPDIKIIFIEDNLSIIEKTRYVENYNYNRLFQVNSNEEQKISRSSINKIKKIIAKKNLKIIFDYGYSLINDEIVKKINNNKNTFINCQTNSYNFGFNRANKYKKVSCLSLDENEFRLIFNNKSDTVDFLIKKNIKFLSNIKYFIVTQGKNGCHLLYNRKIYFFPIIVGSSLDTTGCGDIFLSCFMVFLISKKFSIHEILMASHTAAGLHANTLGNRFNLSNHALLSSIKSYLK